MSVMLLDSKRIEPLMLGLIKFNGLWNCHFLNCNSSGRPNSLDTMKYLKKLYRANCETYNNKYNEHGTVDFTAQPYEKGYNKCQVLKSLEALRYNIEREYCKEASILFKDLDSLISAVKYDIITDLPDYKEAQWS